MWRLVDEGTLVSKNESCTLLWNCNRTKLFGYIEDESANNILTIQQEGSRYKSEIGFACKGDLVSDNEKWAMHSTITEGFCRLKNLESGLFLAVSIDGKLIVEGEVFEIH